MCVPREALREDHSCEQWRLRSHSGVLPSPLVTRERGAFQQSLVPRAVSRSRTVGLIRRHRRLRGSRLQGRSDVRGPRSKLRDKRQKLREHVDRALTREREDRAQESEEEGACMHRGAVPSHDERGDDGGVLDRMNNCCKEGDSGIDLRRVHSSAPKTGVDKRPMPAVGGYERIKMESAYRNPLGLCHPRRSAAESQASVRRVPVGQPVPRLPAEGRLIRGRTSDLRRSVPARQPRAAATHYARPPASESCRWCAYAARSMRSTICRTTAETTPLPTIL